MGKRRHHIENWRDDGGVREILGSVLKDQALSGLLEAKDDPQTLNRVLDWLQRLILDEIARVSSGVGPRSTAAR